MIQNYTTDRQKIIIDYLRFSNRSYFCIFLEADAAEARRLERCLQKVRSCSVASSGKKLPESNPMLCNF